MKGGAEEERRREGNGRHVLAEYHMRLENRLLSAVLVCVCVGGVLRA